MGNGETDTEHMQETEHHHHDVSESVSDTTAGNNDLTLSTAFRRGDSSNVLHQRASCGNLVINGDTDCLLPENDCEDDSQCSTSSSQANVTTAPQREQGGTGPIYGAVMIVNAALGAGVLNFPIAFHEAGGVIAANVVQALMMCFILPALLTLAYCADWNGAKTVQEVMSFTYGKKFERLSSIFITLYCLGTCTTFLIIIGDQFDRVFASVDGPYFCHTWYMNRSFTVVAAAVCFILPFCYPKKIDFLKHISSVGVVTVFYVAGLIIVNYYNGKYVPGEIRTAPVSWTDVFLVVPTLSFGYQCHVSTIPIYSCYKTRTVKNFALSATLALCVCIFMYTIAATYGYLTFGSKIQHDVLSSYDANDPYVMIAIVGFGVKCFTTYPILCYCGNLAIADLYVETRSAQGVLEVDPRIKERVRLISVTCWFIITLFIAVFLPNISSVIKFLGCFAAIFIFIFPGMCLLRIAESPDGITFRTKPKKLVQFFGGLFIVTGSFIFGVVTTNAIVYNFINNSQSQVEPLCLPLA